MTPPAPKGTLPGAPLRSGSAATKIVGAMVAAARTGRNARTLAQADGSASTSNVADPAFVDADPFALALRGHDLIGRRSLRPRLARGLPIRGQSESYAS
jgi:hypothetical protein